MLKLLKKLNSRQWILVGICALLIVLQVYIDLKMPEFMSEITRLVQTPNSSMHDVWIAGLYMLACALGSLLTSILIGFLASRISTTLGYNLRKCVYDKVSSFSMEEINNFSTASLITRTTNDVTQVQMTITMSIQLLLKAPIMAVWAILKIAGKGWQWSTATACAVGILVIMLAIIIIFAIPRFKKIQSLTDDLNAVTRENLTGVRVVRAYNAEEYQEDKFNKTNKKLTDNHLFTSRIMAIMSPGMSLISNGLQLAIYWIGAFLIVKAAGLDKLTIFSDMIVYISYAMQVVMSFMMLVVLFMLLPRASVSAKRINAVLDTTAKIHDGEIEVNNQDNKSAEVEFKNVSFKYPDAEDFVIKDINFKVLPGETIAFIGATGCGKSTIINLIPRFYYTSVGEILVNGINIKDYKQEDLHDLIGYIPQRAVLFSGNIKSNIDFGGDENKKLSDEEIQKAAQIAQASSFIEKTTEKYNYRVAQNGTNLSGGQKQRIAIARAIAKNPQILIFDDSFSALDYKTDKQLRKALKNQENKATTFIVAQRIGTIKDADKIVVIENGEIVGMGKHEQLLKYCEVYQEIAYSQLSKEELGNE